MRQVLSCGLVGLVYGYTTAEATGVERAWIELADAEECHLPSSRVC